VGESKNMLSIPENILPLSGFEITLNDDPTLETISLTLFACGCSRRCEGCQNESIQELQNGNHELLELGQIEKIILDKTPPVSSVVFCGGDFLPNYEKQLKYLIEFCKNKKLKTILYTGEKYEDIDEILKKQLDIVVSEPFILSKKQSSFPASTNQKTWIKGKLVLPSDLKINHL
jgi:anaerobic ribonucleoside-triphosphate reductase activating protein